jgi:HEAT repeat protein
MRIAPLLIAAGIGWSPAVFAQTTTHAHDAPDAVVPAWWDMNDADSLLERMQQAAAGNPAIAARDIAAALMHGVEPRVAAFGLHALAALARREGTVAVQHYLEHRRPTLRRHAVAAAVAIGGPALARAVVARVSDPDPGVRGDAAMALGEMGDRGAIDSLWTALDRDLHGSLDPQGTPLIRGCAHSIARLGNEDAIERLLGYVRRAPFRSLTEAFELALRRNDLSDAVKTRVVSIIGGLATADARDFLLRAVEIAHGRAPQWVELARVSAQRIQVPGGDQ